MEHKSAQADPDQMPSFPGFATELYHGMHASSSATGGHSSKGSQCNLARLGPLINVDYVAQAESASSDEDDSGDPSCLPPTPSLEGAEEGVQGDDVQVQEDKVGERKLIVFECSLDRLFVRCTECGQSISKT